MATRAATRRLQLPEPTRPLNERIYDALRDHILEGRFPDGLILGEMAVSRAFGASRAPASAALRRLCDEGLLSEREGRGFVVGEGAPVRMDLADAGLVLDTADAPRNHRARIYPDAEHAVAACLVYGRFMLNESALAEYYKVSRTVAHEVLTTLERLGLISQDTNQRWYAGPLTADGIRHHFEMRRLLEPVALQQAFARVGDDQLRARRARLALIPHQRISPALVESLELDLHLHTLSACPNPLVLETVRRSQLPLLATHSAFQRLQDPHEIETMAAEHDAIFDALLHKAPQKAAQLLERHLKRSTEPTVALSEHLSDLPPDLARPFLVRVD